jgi:hypothetical protein
VKVLAGELDSDPSYPTTTSRSTPFVPHSSCLKFGAATVHEILSRKALTATSRKTDFAEKVRESLLNGTCPVSRQYGQVICAPRSLSASAVGIN